MSPNLLVFLLYKETTFKQNLQVNLFLVFYNVQLQSCFVFVNSILLI